MKWFFKNLHLFNTRLAFFAKQDVFTSAGMVALSIASWITTFMGMLAYTDLWPIALLGSTGMQILMLYGAVKYADLTDKADTKGFFLITTYFSAMAVSTFFSFAAFYQVIETPQRRVEEADTLLRSDWSRVFNKIDTQAMGEFDFLVKQNNSGGGQSNSGAGSEFSRWTESAAIFKAGADRLQRDLLAKVGLETQALLTKPNLQRAQSVRRRIADSNRAQGELQRRLDALDAEIAAKDAAVREKQALYNKEVSDGGTALRAGGGATRSGVGPIARGHLQDLGPLQVSLAAETAKRPGLVQQVAAARAVLDELNAELAGIPGVAPDEARLAELEAFNAQLAGFKTAVDGFSVPQGLAGGSPQALMGLKDVLTNTVKQCASLKAQAQSMLSISQNVAGAGNLANEYKSLLDSSCDQPPTLSGGRSIPAQVDAINKFVDQCRSERTPDFDRAAAQARAAAAANGAPPRSFREGAVRANGEYALRFHQLQSHYLKCLDSAPRIQSGKARDAIIDDFRDLIQKYNPEAHPFTRAMAAFQRGDLTAYFAFFVAFTMDILIFLTGMASQRAASAGENAAYRADMIHERERADFLAGNRELVDKICEIISSAGERDIPLEDGMVKGCAIPRTWGELQAYSRQLKEMHNLGLLNLQAEDIVVTTQQAAELYRFIGTPYSGS